MNGVLWLRVVGAVSSGISLYCIAFRSREIYGVVWLCVMGAVFCGVLLYCIAFRSMVKDEADHSSNSIAYRRVYVKLMKMAGR